MNDVRFLAALLWETLGWAAVVILFVVGLMLLMGAAS